MAVVTTTREPELIERAPARGIRRETHRLRAGVGAVGAAVTFVVARDGEPWWHGGRGLAAVMLTVLAWLAVSQRRRSGAAAAAFVIGVLAMPAGAGVALPHAAKVGLHPMTLAGFVLLVGGAVLLVSGATTTIAAVRRWWRMPVALALVGLTLVVAWSLGQAVAATNVAPIALGAGTPHDHGLGYREVEFPAADDVVLSGWYIPSANRAAVVLLHGAGSTRSAALEHAAVLANHGYGVLLYDARGHGRSDGRAMDFGWYGDEDVAGAVAFLEAQDDVDDERIAAVGLSMGGEQALGAAATNERLRAVVAEGATNRVADDKDWLSEEFGVRGAIQEGVEWLTYELADLLTAADQPVALRDAVRAMAPRPVLLITAGNVPDEARAARYFQAGSPDTVEVWDVPGTGHTGALPTDPDEWERRVTAFLDRALRDS